MNVVRTFKPDGSIRFTKSTKCLRLPHFRSSINLRFDFNNELEDSLSQVRLRSESDP